VSCVLFYQNKRKDGVCAHPLVNLQQKKKKKEKKENEKEERRREKLLKAKEKEKLRG